MPAISCHTTPTVDGRWNEAERKALEDYAENHLVTARTSAEEALSQDPNSLPGHYILGAVLFENEGRHARAMRHLGRARELYEASFIVGDPNSPWQLHRDILFSIQSLAGELENYEYRVEILDYYNAVYDPDLMAQRAWPLMQLGRFDEARETTTIAIDSGDRWQHQLGLNARCALEGIAVEREAWFEACAEALEFVETMATQDDQVDPENGTNVAVHAYNASEAAMGVLRFTEAEDFAGIGARRLAFTPANPWRMLVRLYTTQGRMSEAVSALHEMRRWQARQPPNLRDHDRAKTDTILAIVLLVAGESEAGRRAIERALDYPDRSGLTSTGTDEALGGQSIIHRAILQLERERLAEEAVTSEGTRLERLQLRLTAIAERLRDTEQTRNVAANTERLLLTIRPYTQGGFEPLPTWLVPELIEIIGVGVFSVALELAREAESDPQFDSYFNAYEAEVSLHQRNFSRCIELVTVARQELPTVERLLRARVAAVGAQCAQREHNEEQELAYLAEAMNEDPGVVRRFGLSLPATIEVNVNGEAGEQVAKSIRRSPRFQNESGFFVTVSGGDNELRFSLASPYGDQLAQAIVLREEEENDDDFASRTSAIFHQQAFAMPLNISSQDLNSLDGHVTYNREDAREQMNDLLEGVMDSEPIGP